MRERISIFVDFGTTFEDVKALKNEMQAFVLDKENSRDFQPDIDVEVVSIAEMNKMELRAEIRHKSNWANETVRAARRSKFMCALVLALRKIPVSGPGGAGAALGSSDNPNFSVALTPDIAAENKQAFADKQEAKRLYPSKKPDEPAPGTFPTPPSGLGNLTSNTATGAAEARAIDALNTRPPGADLARDDAWDGRDEDHRDDSSTLGDTNNDHLGHRASTDHQSIEDVRSLLHRTSTRGKRKAGEGLSATTSLGSGRPPMHTIQSGLSVGGVNERTPGGFPVTPMESGEGYKEYADRLAPQYTQSGGAGGGTGTGMGMSRPAVQGNAFARPPQGQGLGPYRL